MGRVAAIVCVLFVALLSGCTKSEYWVKGLTLPKTSTVAAHKSETTEVSGAPAMALPMLGTVEKTLVVGVNDPGGWATVSSHVDACMPKEGYADGMASMTGMGAAGMPPQAAAMLGGMRMYTKAGEKYAVMLMDMGSMASAMGSAAASMPAGMPGSEDVTLTVLKLK